MKKEIERARELVENLTPLKNDCGQICGAACCQPDEDGQGGVALFLAYRPVNALRLSVPRPDAKAMFEAVLDVAERLSARLVDRLHDGSLATTLRVVFVALTGVGLYAVWGSMLGNGARPTLPISAPAIVAWGALVAASLATIVWHGERLLALVLTSVVGVVVALIFIQFSAPDLALTQISVDVVTTILMLLALNLLPKQTPSEMRTGPRIGDGLIAIAGGFGVAALAYGVMTSEGPRAIADYYLATSKPGGGGTNVVNVILVDFRGYDTFAEIIVLGIAAISIFALLDISLKGSALKRIRALLPKEEAGDAHPLILVVVARLLLPLSLAVGVYIFLRGHNEPGGGFIAGLVVAIALIIQYIASGYVWASERRRFDPHAMIGAGVGIAGLAGVAPWAFGQPFLKSTFGYVTWPVVGKFELASAMVFDLGVFLTVVGVVILSLARLSRVAQRVDPVPPTGAMDIPLENKSAEGA